MTTTSPQLGLGISIQYILARNFSVKEKRMMQWPTKLQTVNNCMVHSVFVDGSTGSWSVSKSHVIASQPIVGVGLIEEAVW